MIIEMRTYTLQPGAVPDYVRLYETEGMPIQRPILGHMVGYFFTEIGALNQIIHMWAYDDLNERARRRSELAKQPGWADYLKKARLMIVTQENKILHGASFSPIK